MNKVGFDLFDLQSSPENDNLLPLIPLTIKNLYTQRTSRQTA